MTTHSLKQPITRLGMALPFAAAAALLAACASPNAPIPAATPTTTGALSPAVAAESRVIQEAAAEICPPTSPSPQFTMQNPDYGFFCAMAAGHGTSVTIHRYPDLAEAQAGFQEAAESQPTQSFHGCPFAQWQEEHPYTGDAGSSRIAVWQADRWLVRIQSEDDTHYLIAADPAEAAEILYELAAKHALFTCEEQP